MSKNVDLRNLDFNNAGAWPKEWQIGFCVLLGLLILIVLWNFMTSSKGDTLEALEKMMVQKMLVKHAGNITHAAKELGITRTALYRRIEKHGL